MEGETYRVDLTFEVPPPTDPALLANAAMKLSELLPPGSQTIRIDSGADPEGVGRVAARVRANGPAHALRSVAWAVEIIAAESNQLDDLGPMRLAVVEHLGD